MTGAAEADAAHAAHAAHAELRPQAPWPGLESYDEASEPYFHGREREVAALLQTVQRAPLTLLYGKSGLGKSSLLKAGIFPELRRRNFLPVWVRLDLLPSAGHRLVDQMLAELLQELERVGADFPPPAPGQDLWEYLHPAAPCLWSTDNFALTPVLVFDQFEELLVPAQAGSERTQQLFNDLGNLVDNRIPPHLETDEAGPARERLDMRSQRYRVVLSFREDFLPDLKGWERRMPTLGRDFLRLEPMSAGVARDAVARAGKEVIAPGAEADIVEFVGRQDASDTAPSEAVTIEPVLLSLCCSELNLRRPPGGRIDRALIESTGQGILETFYSKALAQPEVQGPPDVAEFIETHLIQGDRYRGDFPVAEATAQGLLKEPQLQALIGARCRLLRIVQKADAPRVELIHDRLVPVVRKARDARQAAAASAEREQQAEQARLDLQREQAASGRLKRQRNLSGALALAAILALVGSFVESRRAARANDATHRTLDITDLAASFTSLASGHMAMRERVDPWELTVKQALTAYHQSETDSTPALMKVRRLSLLAMSTYVQRYSHLRRIVYPTGVDLTPALAYSPDGRTLALGTRAGTIRLLDAATLKLERELICSPAHLRIWSLAFSDNGDKLVASEAGDDTDTANRSVCVFDLKTGQWPVQLPVVSAVNGKPTDLYSVAIAQGKDGERVAAAGSDHAMHVWSLTTREEHSYRFADDSEVVAVAFSGDRRTVAAGTDSGAIWLVDLDDAKAKPVALKAPGERSAHGAVIQELAFSQSDPNWLVSVSDDGRLRGWNLQGRCLAAQSTQQVSTLFGLALRPDSNLVAVAGADGIVRLFSMHKRECRAGFKPDDKEMRIEVIPEGELHGHNDNIYVVAFSPDGDTLVSAGVDGSLRFWEGSAGGASIGELTDGDGSTRAGERPAASITALAISSDSDRFAAGDAQGNIRIWQAPPEREAQTLPLPARPWQAYPGTAVRALVLLPGAKTGGLISADEAGHIDRWNLDGSVAPGEHAFAAMPAREGRGSRNLVTLVRSPDATHLAAGWQDGAVAIWETASGRLVRSFVPPAGSAGPRHKLLALGFTSDGRHVAVSSSLKGDPENWLVPVDTTANVIAQRLSGHRDNVVALANGGNPRHWLVSADAQGEILAWPPDTARAAPPAVDKLSLRKPGFDERISFGEQVNAIDMSADGALTVIAGAAGRVQLWDTADDGMLIGEKFSSDRRPDVDHVAMAPNARYFVTVEDRKVMLWPGPSLWPAIVCQRLAGNTTPKECPAPKPEPRAKPPSR